MKLAVIAAVLAGGCSSAPLTGERALAPAGAFGDFAVPVRSVAARRFEGVIRQRYDFSCGSAALATLLRYHHDLDVGEDRAFRGMWARGDRAAIRRVGFSLLDMKRWLASRGVGADGYKVPLDRIAETGVPGIALIAVRNYRHFVVVKGVTDREVLIGDPSAGLTVMPRARFEAAWNGIYFVLTGDQRVARARFNRPREWVAFVRAPIGGGHVDPVSQQALALTAPAYGDI